MFDSGGRAVAGSFNSATAVKPWRLESGNKAAAAEIELQFGHGGEAVETEVVDVPRALFDVLQFGHGGEAVETPTAATAGAAKVGGFNSATAVKPWRPLAAVYAERGEDWASIRPRR